MMLNSRILGSLVMTAIALGAGCSMSGGNDDLVAYIEEVKSRPRGNIEPLPPLRTYDAYVYNVMAKRSPFEPPVDTPVLQEKAKDPNLEPQWERPKEYLEGFSFESLTMVGSLKKQGGFWVLIKDSDGGINRVGVGNYIGKDHGKIVATSPTQVDVEEIVSDGLGGWLKRPRTLTLSESEKE